MKWLHGTSHNTRHGFTEDEKEIESVIELVVVFSETKSRMVGSNVVRVDAVSDFRVCMSPLEATALAASLVDYAEQAERQADKIEVKND
jgi:hypothetical protein